MWKLRLGAFCASFTLMALSTIAHADVHADVQARCCQHQPEKKVDLVLALDVSGSMSGLINSAKQRLWDIVNVMGNAQPRPQLRVAVMTYGNPGYGVESGYVRIDQPFTTDLDQVSEVLFSFGTNGGDEYVARTIDTAVRELQWSENAADNLRILFVAGNESATQDPEIPLEAASALAAQHNIVVNTLFCGDLASGIATGWQRASNLANGMYANIDQNAAAVAQVATPMDSKIAELNEKLNETYIAFGNEAEEVTAKRLKQDKNAADMSLSSAVSRAVTKAGDMYRNAWDLVDAIQSGTEISTIPEAELPEEMQAMSPESRVAHIEKKAEKRDQIRQEIQTLADDREDYIADQVVASGDSNIGLDTAIKTGLAKAAESKGIIIKQ